MQKRGQIYTIGHSTLSKEEFLKTIESVDTVVDIRSHPTSKWTQFYKEEMEEWLPKNGIQYEWNPKLGGWTQRHLKFEKKFTRHGVDISVYASGKFPKQHIAKTMTKSDRLTWYNQGLYDFSWFMTLRSFMRAVDEIIVRSKLGERIGIMCAELLWWRCHRSMVADYLTFIGADPIHLQPELVHHSDVIGSRLDRYDPRILKKWTNYNSDYEKDRVENAKITSA